MSVYAEGSAYALLTDDVTVEIRPARPEDFAAVRDMHEAASRAEQYAWPALAVLALRSVNARLAWHCLSAWCYLGRVRDQFCLVL
jgi:hypothetical protein